METKFNYSKIIQLDEKGEKKAAKAPVTKTQSKLTESKTVLTKLNLRQRPSTSAPILEVLEAGETIETDGEITISENEMWLNAKHVSFTGYVMARFVK